MIEDVSVRGFAEKTRNDHIRNVRVFTAFIGWSLDAATVEEMPMADPSQTLILAAEHRYYHIDMRSTGGRYAQAVEEARPRPQLLPSSAHPLCCIIPSKPDQ
jgi:hypothetical protein